MEIGLRNWLRISLVFGADNDKRWKYIDFDNPQEGLQKLLSDSTLQNNVYARALHHVSSAQLDSLIDICSRNDISIITPEDCEYPEALRNIPNPPAVLFVLGDIANISDRYAAAIVGARDCCEYTMKVTAHFSAELSRAGYNIVSGFARGVDSQAHMAALKCGGVTTAVLGCGILNDYPRGTLGIKRQIAERGAVISEYLPTAKPAPENFKVRNRLITGLSDCVVVTEAGERSGSLNSANHALEQGKELFVIPPHDLFSPSFSGQSALIRDGAITAVDPEFIVNHMKMFCHTHE